MTDPEALPATQVSFFAESAAMTLSPKEPPRLR
jgi:hypothetical protein